MAKVKENTFTGGLNVKSDTQPVFHYPRNVRTAGVSQPDFSNRVAHAGHFRSQSRFQQAAAYAQVAAKTMPVYTALAQNTSSDPYHLALSDWLHAPVIHEVTRLPERIRVDATDNVLVSKVVVTISDEQGQILEQGQAVLIDDVWWEYAASVSTDGIITVEAFDLAGNCTKHQA